MPCPVRLCARGVLGLHKRSRVIDNGNDMKQSNKVRCRGKRLWRHKAAYPNTYNLVIKATSIVWKKMGYKYTCTYLVQILFGRR